MPPDNRLPPGTLSQNARRRELTIEELVEHIDSRFNALEDLIRSGFPEGDPARHREVHEGYIREAKERRELWKSVREKTISSGVWAGLMMIAAALYNYLGNGGKQ